MSLGLWWILTRPLKEMNENEFASLLGAQALLCFLTKHNLPICYHICSKERMQTNVAIKQLIL